MSDYQVVQPKECLPRQSSLEIAKNYRARGWAPLPVPFREKGPRIVGWNTLVLKETELPSFFNEEPSNIAILLGDASGGMVDIDLDCPEAGAIAASVLPKTAVIFGRKSNPASHWIYRTDNPGTCGSRRLGNMWMNS
jgi:hypothetical protein